MSEICEGCSGEDSAPRRQYWSPCRRKWFKKCSESQKLIWPFQLCYRNTYSTRSLRPNIRSMELVTVYISAATYTFKTLRGEV